jgi:hypothetical protein
MFYTRGKYISQNNSTGNFLVEAKIVFYFDVSISFSLYPTSVTSDYVERLATQYSHHIARAQPNDPGAL